MPTLTQAEATDTRAHYVTDFESFARETAASEPESIGALRRRAIESFDARGFPTLRDEEWRFTNVSPIVKTEFSRRAATAVLGEEELETFTYRGLDRLLIVDGVFSPELSSIGELPAGVILGSLARALSDQADQADQAEEAEEASHAEQIALYLGRYAKIDANPFAALNTAFFRDGALVWLPPGAVLERPVHLLFISTLSPDPDQTDGRPPVTFPRNLIVAGENSQAILVESYVTLGEGVHFTCPVTELAAEAGAVLDHYKVQKESRQAFHMATFQLHQERASNVSSHSISTGSAILRNDTNVVLDAEGCECTLNGLYVVNGTQVVDNHMRVDHAKPHCNSYELFKGILDERARAVFNGRIFVHEDAQKTDAKQSSRNLLLSREALVNANPQLEIFAADVKCTHGSTVGRLDEDAIFYLRSRGIGEQAARSILTYAFASDIIERIKIDQVRDELAEFLFSRLPRGEIVRQAV